MRAVALFTFSVTKKSMAGRDKHGLVRSTRWSDGPMPKRGGAANGNQKDRSNLKSENQA